jgi:hypothetical protein
VWVVSRSLDATGSVSISVGTTTIASIKDSFDSCSSISASDRHLMRFQVKGGEGNALSTETATDLTARTSSSSVPFSSDPLIIIN